MPKDEFNHINITNEKEIRGVEFGKVQGHEYSFQRDNLTNKNELNKGEPKNELNEDVNEHHQIAKDKKESLIEEKIKNQLETGTGAAGETGASAVSSSAVASSAAASSGAVAASSVVGASAVVVTAFTVITATPIILSNARAELYNFEVGEHEVFYELELLETVENENYRLILSNDKYEEIRELEPGINHGEFFDLLDNTEYKFTVEEGTDIELKRTLLSKSFTTNEEIKYISEFHDFIFDKSANFIERYFEVQLDYIDELDIYHDFSFTLTDLDNDYISYKYPLEKTNEKQVIYLDVDEIDAPYFDLDDHFSYTVSYYENEQEIIFKEEEFYFIDNSGGVSEFNDGEISNNADFLNKTFDVTLDYIDDFDILSDFNLVIYNQEVGLSTQETYPLDKTISSQTISYANSSLDIENTTLNYYFTYLRKGILEESSTKEISFSDKESRTSQFNGATINTKADFIEKTITVQLDYVDTLNRFSDFTLHIERVINASDSGAYKPNNNKAKLSANSDSSITYPLEKTTEVQTIAIENDAIDLENGTYSYYVSYLDEDNEVSSESQSVTFVDVEDRKSIFNSASIDEKADFIESTFDVILDFVDDFDRLSDFVLHISQVDEIADVPFSRDYSLTKTTGTQTLSSIEDETNPGFDLENGSYSYYFTYVNNGATITTETKTITFKDKLDRKSIFNDLTINKADFENKKFLVTLDYVDDYNRLSDFNLSIKDETKDITFEYQLDKSTDTQSFDAVKDNETHIEMMDLERDSFSYILTYVDNGTTITKEGTTTFTDINNKTSKVNGINFEVDDSNNPLLNFGTNILKVTLDYTDYFDYFDDFRLLFYSLETSPDGAPTSEEQYFEIDLTKTTNEQSASIADSASYGVDIKKDTEYKYELIYHTIEDSDTPITAMTSTVTFTDSSVSKINDVTVGRLHNGNGSWYIPFKLDFIDERNEFTNLSMYLVSSDNESVYLVQQTETGSVEHDMDWQYCYFSYDDVSVFTSKPCYVQFKRSTGEIEEVVYSKEINLTLDDETKDFEAIGLRVKRDIYINSDGTSIVVPYYITNGNYLDASFTLRFVDSSSKQYDFTERNIQGVAYSDTISITASDYEELITKIQNNESFSVYIIYKDSNEQEVSVLCYTSFTFEVHNT